jgi:hypothetical protein
VTATFAIYTHLFHDDHCETMAALEAMSRPVDAPPPRIGSGCAALNGLAVACRRPDSIHATASGAAYRPLCLRSTDA